MYRNLLPNTQNFHQTFKTKLTDYQNERLFFKNENENLALNNKKNSEVFANYLENLLYCPEPANKLQPLETNNQILALKN